MLVFAVHRHGSDRDLACHGEIGRPGTDQKHWSFQLQLQTNPGHFGPWQG